jgi:sigma-B regulation protein RsbU (phosphoserine phosphatase)
VYAILEVPTLTLTYSRAGHPEPILVRRDGRGNIERLEARGSLLGIFPGEQFPFQRVQLAPGDRVLFYSDGLEEALRRPQGLREPMEQLLGQHILRPRDEMLLRLSDRMDINRGQSPLSDDVTLLVLDIE